MSADSKAPLKVRCPSCGTPVEYLGLAANPFFPFCCERCKLVDLGKWLNEEHHIEEPLPDGTDGEETADEPAAGTRQISVDKPPGDV